MRNCTRWEWRQPKWQGKYIVSIFEDGNQRIIPPFEFKEGESKDVVIVLNVFVELLNVGKEVVHVVFGPPPRKSEAHDEGVLESRHNVEIFIVSVDARVGSPSSDDLREGESSNTK